MPKLKLTGTQKKAMKFGAKEAVKEEKRLRPFKREARRGAEDIFLRGKGLPPTDIKQISRQFQDALKYAKPEFEAQKQQTLQDYARYTEPEIVTGFGAGQGARSSSALTQALAQGRVDLASKLNAQYENLRNQVAQNVMNQGYQSQVVGLNARLQAMSPFLGSQLNSVASNLAVNSPYQQPAQKQGSDWGGAIGGLAEGGGKAYLAWQLAKLAAAPATGGASMAAP